MLAIFRSTQAYLGLPFLLYALLLQLPAFFAVPVLGRGARVYGYLGSKLVDWADQYYWLAVGLPVLLLATQAVQAGLLTNRHHYTRTPTQLAALGTLLIWGLVPGFRWLHPGMVANVFLFAALLSLAGVYKNQYPQINIFNIGCWLGLASLFVPAYLLFIIPFYVASGILWRSELSSILRLVMGAGVMVFLIGTAAYFYGDWAPFASRTVPRFTFDLTPAGPLELTAVIALTTLAIAMVLSSGKLMHPISIEGKKGVSTLCWLLLFTPVVVAFTGGFSVVDAYVVVVPLGVLLGLWLNTLPPRVAGLAHLLLLSAGLLVGASRLLALVD